MTHKDRKKSRNFMFWNAGCSLLRDEGFFCCLDVLYGGPGIGKLQFLTKYLKNFQLYIFFTFWSSKPWIRIGSESGTGSVFSINCWIRNQSLRIQVLDRPLLNSAFAVNSILKNACLICVPSYMNFITFVPVTNILLKLVFESYQVFITEGTKNCITVTAIRAKSAVYHHKALIH